MRGRPTLQGEQPPPQDFEIVAPIGTMGRLPCVVHVCPRCGRDLSLMQGFSARCHRPGCDGVRMELASPGHVVVAGSTLVGVEEERPRAWFERLRRSRA
jgi:hypothetical protein